MNIYVEKPVAVKVVKGTVFFVDGKPVEHPTYAFELYQTLYGNRIADYLRSLKVHEGTKHCMNMTFMPPFRNGEEDGYRGRVWHLRGFDLKVESGDNGLIGYVKVYSKNHREKRKILSIPLPQSFKKMAEMTYKVESPNDILKET